MTTNIQIAVALLAVLAVVAVAARKLRTAPSILLVIVGVALALVPGLPAIQFAPDFVLLVLLPPIIYLAGVFMSWREFRLNLNAIALLAFGCVVFTTVAVAATVHWIFAWPWAVGFLLGAIVAPTDVVAPLALAQHLNVPRRLLVILEGEGLVNDATALVLYRFAVIAIASGSFSLGEAIGEFALIVVGEIAYGVAVGWLLLRLRRWVGDPRVEIVLSIITPYAAYWIPHQLGGSGVLAAAAAGLYVSWQGPLLIPSPTRLQGIFFWDLIVYVIEGMLFLLTGLQARALLADAGAVSWRQLAAITAVTCAVLIVARFAWVLPTTYVRRWWRRRAGRGELQARWQAPFMVAYTGVRGVVSLAAALAIPLTLATGEPFPDRNLILVVTFGVIIFTLLGLGSPLPTVIRLLGLARDGYQERRTEQDAERNARFEILDVAQKRLHEIASARNLPQQATALLSSYFDGLRRQLPRSSDSDIESPSLAGLRVELIEAERRYLHEMLRQGRITDESRRRIERELDLEEATLASRVADRK